MIQYTITSETPAEGQATEGRFTTRHKKLQGTLCGTLQGACFLDGVSTRLLRL